MLGVKGVRRGWKGRVKEGSGGLKGWLGGLGVERGGLQEGEGVGSVGGIVAVL